MDNSFLKSCEYNSLFSFHTPSRILESSFGIASTILFQILRELNGEKRCICKLMLAQCYRLATNTLVLPLRGDKKSLQIVLTLYFIGHGCIEDASDNLSIVKNTEAMILRGEKPRPYVLRPTRTLLFGASIVFQCPWSQLVVG